MSEGYSYIKKEETNHDWAKEVRARLADLNELLEEAVKRDVIVTGNVAMSTCYAMTNSGLQGLPTIMLTLSERI